jgi:hypothetical protein
VVTAGFLKKTETRRAYMKAISLKKMTAAFKWLYIHFGAFYTPKITEMMWEKKYLDRTSLLAILAHAQ